MLGMREKFLQFALCTIMPLPLEMYPTISSPYTGEQQRAIVIRKFVVSPMRIFTASPLVDFAVSVCSPVPLLCARVCLGAGGGGPIFSMSKLGSFS